MTHLFQNLLLLPLQNKKHIQFLFASVFLGFVLVFARTLLLKASAIEDSADFLLYFMLAVSLVFLVLVSWAVLISRQYQFLKKKSWVLYGALGFTLPSVLFLLPDLLDTVQSELSSAGTSGENLSASLLFTALISGFALCVLSIWRVLILATFNIFGIFSRRIFLRSFPNIFPLGASFGWLVIRPLWYYCWAVFSEFIIFIVFPLFGFLIVPLPLFPNRSSVKQVFSVEKESKSDFSNPGSARVFLISSKISLSARLQLNANSPEDIAENVANSLLPGLTELGKNENSNEGSGLAPNAVLHGGELNPVGTYWFVFSETFFAMEASDLRKMSAVLQGKLSANMSGRPVGLVMGVRTAQGNMVFVWGTDPVTNRNLGGFIYQKNLLVPFFEERFLGVLLQSDSSDFGLSKRGGRQRDEFLSERSPLSQIFFKPENNWRAFICYEAISFLQWWRAWRDEKHYGAKRLSPFETMDGPGRISLQRGTVRGESQGGVHTKWALVITNQGHFATWGVASGVYELLINQLASLFGSNALLVSNFGTTHPTGPYGGFDFDKAAKHSEMPIRFDVLPFCSGSCLAR